MKIICTAILVCTLAPIGLAQSGPSQKRVNEIMETAMHRMVAQDNIWFGDGEFPKVVQNLKILYRFIPADYETATNLGWMLENIDEFGEALALYKDFRKSNPTGNGAADPEANYYYRQRQWDKIPPILEPVIPKYADPNTYRMLAHAYEKMSKFKDAERIWKAYIVRNPHDQAAKNNLRRVSSKIGK